MPRKRSGLGGVAKREYNNFPALFGTLSTYSQIQAASDYESALKHDDPSMLQKYSAWSHYISKDVHPTKAPDRKSRHEAEMWMARSINQTTRFFLGKAKFTDLEAYKMSCIVEEFNWLFVENRLDKLDYSRDVMAARRRGENRAVVLKAYLDEYRRRELDGHEWTFDDLFKLRRKLYILRRNNREDPDDEDIPDDRSEDLPDENDGPRDEIDLTKVPKEYRAEIEQMMPKYGMLETIEEISAACIDEGDWLLESREERRSHLRRWRYYINYDCPSRARRNESNILIWRLMNVDAAYLLEMPPDEIPDPWVTDLAIAVEEWIYIAQEELYSELPKCFDIVEVRSGPDWSCKVDDFREYIRRFLAARGNERWEEEILLDLRRELFEVTQAHRKLRRDADRSDSHDGGDSGGPSSGGGGDDQYGDGENDENNDEDEDFGTRRQRRYGSVSKDGGRDKRRRNVNGADSKNRHAFPHPESRQTEQERQHNSRKDNSYPTVARLGIVPNRIKFALKTRASRGDEDVLVEENPASPSVAARHRRESRRISSGKAQGTPAQNTTSPARSSRQTKRAFGTTASQRPLHAQSSKMAGRRILGDDVETENFEPRFMNLLAPNLGFAVSSHKMVLPRRSMSTFDEAGMDRDVRRSLREGRDLIDANRRAEDSYLIEQPDEEEPEQESPSRYLSDNMNNYGDLYGVSADEEDPRIPRLAHGHEAEKPAIIRAGSESSKGGIQPTRKVSTGKGSQSKSKAKPMYDKEGRGDKDEQDNRKGSDSSSQEVHIIFPTARRDRGAKKGSSSKTVEDTSSNHRDRPHQQSTARPRPDSMNSARKARARKNKNKAQQLAPIRTFQALPKSMMIQSEGRSRAESRNADEIEQDDNVD